LTPPPKSLPHPPEVFHMSKRSQLDAHQPGPHPALIDSDLRTHGAYREPGENLRAKIEIAD
jgi:hypothetical protein